MKISNLNNFWELPKQQNNITIGVEKQRLTDYEPINELDLIFKMMFWITVPFLRHVFGKTEKKMQELGPGFCPPFLKDSLTMKPTYVTYLCSNQCEK